MPALEIIKIKGDNTECVICLLAEINKQLHNLFTQIVRLLIETKLFAINILTSEFLPMTPLDIRQILKIRYILNCLPGKCF